MDDAAAAPKAAIPMLQLGEPAPWFSAPTKGRADFSFSSVAGRYVVLGFMPADRASHALVTEVLADNVDLTDDVRVSVFLVVRDPEIFAAAQERRGRRCLLDHDGEVARLCGRVGPEGEAAPGWMVFDPSMRLLMLAPYGQAAALFARLRGLPEPDAHAGPPMHAPVLIVPRILEPEICRQLIACYDADGGQPSGVMREIDGKVVGVLDDFKRRRDTVIRDEAVRHALRVRIGRRLIPQIERAFQFKATRIERYIVACYDAADGGYFRPHRDNTTPATAHRRFAVSINLNAEDFEGGDLRFAEFGRRTYRPPTGGAVVFSCSLLHEATPVTRGRRYAFLPFLFAEADEVVRAGTAHLIQPSAQPAPA